LKRMAVMRATSLLMKATIEEGMAKVAGMAAVRAAALATMAVRAISAATEEARVMAAVIIAVRG
jgi:hypothetical protein